MRVYRYVVTPTLLCAILFFLANSIGLFNRGVETSVNLNRIDADTTIHVVLSRFGSPLPDNKRVGGQFFIRAKGKVNQPTEVQVFSRNEKTPVLYCLLTQGIVDTVWGGDFYTSEAVIQFRHKQATRGKLALDFVFSYPPNDWKFRPKRK